jgi:hypothetical protein
MHSLARIEGSPKVIGHNDTMLHDVARSCPHRREGVIPIHVDLDVAADIPNSAALPMAVAIPIESFLSNDPATTKETTYHG